MGSEESTDRVDAPLIVITGPTASGKTALAIILAQRYNGEIICADSRTVYKGMDIGTAKPTVEEQNTVPHWGIDLVDPGERFSAAEFQRYAQQKIVDIRKRGRVPFLVGGTGLYIDAVVLEYQFGTAADEVLRTRLEGMSVNQLQSYCSKNNIKLPQNVNNKRHLVRAIEQKGINQRRRGEPIDNCFVVAIATDRDTLRTRILQRSEQFFEDNVVREARILGKKYGWQSEAMTGNIYPILYKYLSGEISLAAAKEQFFYSDWHLAKRQLTWFRRRPYVQWLSLQEAEHYLSQQLASYKRMC